MATNNITAIKAYLEKFDNKLIMQTLNSLDIFKDLSAGVMRNLTTEVSLPKVTMGDGVRPLDVDIETAKHNRVWAKRTITPRFGMKIFSVVPDELLETFMGEMMIPGQKKEPFAAWLWAREFEKMGEEINDNFFYQEYAANAAAYNGGNAYSTGDVVVFTVTGGIPEYYKANQAVAAGETPETTAAKWDEVSNQVLYDGPGTIIKDEITGANITPVVTGAIDNTNAYDKFILVWDSIPEAYKNKKPVALVAHDVAQDLITNINTLFGSGKGIENDLDTKGVFVLKGTAGRLTVKPVTWMAGSQRIVTTLPGNIRVGTNRERHFNGTSKLIEKLHGYDAVAKFALASQIADLEALWVNDQV